MIRGNLTNLPTYSFLECSVVQAKPYCIIDVSSGFKLGFQVPIIDIECKAVEVCAGAGFMGEGLSACGVSIQASNDLQSELCAFQVRQGQQNVFVGDIGQASVIAAIHTSSGQPTIISGGFSCQPWSQLGDRRGLDDNRSSSLNKILQAGHWLRARSILLECVCAAGVDDQVKSVIQCFCKQTGYRVTAGDLLLESLLPAKRARWWCVISDASVPPFSIRPLPVLHPKPTLAEMLPVLPSWDLSDFEQLVLDRYETNKFMEFGGLFENMLRGDDQVRTALHGWANQLTSCPCGCRKHPFSEERLRNKGIFVALIPIQGEFNTYQGTLPMTRHMHPWEMCWIHGANPNRLWKPSMCLGIAAAGQMATPVQSCWVVAQLQAAAAQGEGIPLAPEQALWNHFQVVFAAATMTHPAITGHESFKAFELLHVACISVCFTPPRPMLGLHCPLGPVKKIQTASDRDARTLKVGFTKVLKSQWAKNRQRWRRKNSPFPCVCRPRLVTFQQHLAPHPPCQVPQF